MQKKTMDLALLKKAQQATGRAYAHCGTGQRGCVGLLFRLTLDVHVAEDLCQETLVQMLKSLPRLELASERSFGPGYTKPPSAR